MKETKLEKTAVIVVDMLNDFVNEDGALVVEGAKKLIPKHEEILRVARENGAKIIYLTDNHLEDDPEFKIWPAHAIRNTKGAKVIDELAPEEEDRVIPKRKYSGFQGTDLDATLREDDIETIILIGVLTDICVMYTSADASAKGYNVLVVSDGTWSSSEKNHEFALEHIQSVHGSTVLSTSELLTMMT